MLQYCIMIRKCNIYYHNQNVGVFMIKKLVKHGNSNAIILDRAILELLNISEGSLVKLHTDGKSLIITSAEPERAATPTPYMSGTERLMAIEQSIHDAINADPIKRKEWEKWQPGGELYTKLKQLTEKLMEKYHEDLKKAIQMHS